MPPLPLPTKKTNFYPRPPRGGRPLPAQKLFAQTIISIHALREEGDTTRKTKYPDFSISIHALREEGDIFRQFRHLKKRAISIHALREEGDRVHKYFETAAFRFLSTPSARRATWLIERKIEQHENFYPRPPRGGRLADVDKVVAQPGISIHALREEGDAPAQCGNAPDIIFLSTPSARRATVRNTIGAVILAGNFYPRPPRGGRPIAGWSCSAQLRFLSTPSARRATAKTEKNISAFVSL